MQLNKQYLNAKFVSFWLFGFLILFLTPTKAQVCNGALGDPVIKIDFGNGANKFGPPLLSTQTDYTYIQGTPDAGQYAIAKNTFGMHNTSTGWHQVTNHTANDPDGYMMVVDAALNPGVFYQTKISGLCPQTTYEFGAWIMNILNYAAIKPNVTFQIEDLFGKILKPYSTQDILESTAPEWKRYAMLFDTRDNTDVVLKIRNNAAGQGGNDLALDDITFRACGPAISSTVTNVKAGLNNISYLCAGDTKTVKIDAAVTSGVYNSPQLQWQEFIGNNWIDSTKPGAQTSSLTVDFLNATIGSYKYQVLVSETGNINSSFCRVVSTPVNLIVSDIPAVMVTNSGTACVGSAVQLTATGGILYNWSGPNGFTSTLQNPILNSVDLTMAGKYSVIVANEAGCVSAGETEVKVTLPMIASTNIVAATICENENILLEASGGTIYSWSPIEGLSDSNVANPIASPKKNTIYTVKIANEGCSATKTIEITVLKSAIASAGNDKKVLGGQSAMLDGKAEGDGISYFWTPTSYLDDPTKLNPIASPPIDITYTLTVQSKCNVSYDRVFVKVYPKIEIPNTFTPNGDGMNDTWNIPALAAFANPKLKVINRLGNVVFQNTNSTVWDGKYKGKDLPSGTYYYTLYLNDEFKIYSGWVLLTR